MEAKDNSKKKSKNESSYLETMNFLNSRLKKYDTSHENFVVPWQLGERKKKEFNF